VTSDATSGAPGVTSGVTVPPSRKSSRKNGMEIAGRSNAHDRVARINAMTIRIIKHEVIPLCGSFEVQFADGRPSFGMT
jgi:hypothetical protein